jgi:hypothetical protein
MLSNFTLVLSAVHDLVLGLSLDGPGGVILMATFGVITTLENVMKNKKWRFH